MHRCALHKFALLSDLPPLDQPPLMFVSDQGAVTKNSSFPTTTILSNLGHLSQSCTITSILDILGDCLGGGGVHWPFFLEPFSFRLLSARRIPKKSFSETQTQTKENEITQFGNSSHIPHGMGKRPGRAVRQREEGLQPLVPQPIASQQQRPLQGLASEANTCRAPDSAGFTAAWLEDHRPPPLLGDHCTV